MKSIHRIIALAVLAGSLPAFASTVAYWRFEEGPADANVPHPGTGGVWSADTADSSGNSNELSVWTEGGGCGFAYRTDVAAATVPQTGAANNFSVQNTGGWPAMWTETGTLLQLWSLDEWTIEVAFKLENSGGGYRTIVGRDSQGAYAGDPNLAALYLQMIPNNGLTIKFCDVNGYWHEATSKTGVVTGFDWGSDPTGSTGKWYAVAAVSDGLTLSLYLKDIKGGGDYELIAQANMTLSGSPKTALTPGGGDGSDWDPGNFSVGRGLYAGGHVDRAFGFIDEVRISNTALTKAEFLFTPTPVPDSDLDGLSDAWEITHFGSVTVWTGTGDPDKDGYDNEAEETAGSNPTVKASVPGDTDGNGKPG